MKESKLTPEMEARKWKPGESGNPGGRPKKRPISDRYEVWAEKPLDQDMRLALKLPKGATYGDAMAYGQFRAAIKGKADAAREIREAVEGKATQRLEIAEVESDPTREREMIDYGKLSNEEFAQLEVLIQKAR